MDTDFVKQVVELGEETGAYCIFISGRAVFQPLPVPSLIDPSRPENLLHSVKHGRTIHKTISETLERNSIISDLEVKIHEIGELLYQAANRDPQISSKRRKITPQEKPTEDGMHTGAQFSGEHPESFGPEPGQLASPSSSWYAVAKVYDACLTLQQD